MSTSEISPVSPYLKGVGILLVDPKPFMRRLMGSVLRLFGATEICESTDGAAAFEDAKNFVPDLVITEFAMAPVDGLELVRLLRRSQATPNRYVPIIMATAYSEVHNVVAARDVGVNEFVIKPLSGRSLMTRIEQVVENARPFVDVPAYFGPDRRRRYKAGFAGQDRRGDGRPAAPPGRPVDQEQADRLIAGENIG